MSDIFLSYANADRDHARMMAEYLDAKGWSVWWDRTIPPGREFDDVIEEALDSAKCVVVLWSTSGIASTWVKTEAAVAMSRRVLVPVLIERVKIPLEFRRLQAADLSGWQDLKARQKPETQEQLDALIQSIAHLVTQNVTRQLSPRSEVGKGAHTLDGAASSEGRKPPREPGARKHGLPVIAIVCVMAILAALALYLYHAGVQESVRAEKEQAAKEQAAKGLAAAWDGSSEGGGINFGVGGYVWHVSLNPVNMQITRAANGAVSSATLQAFMTERVLNANLLPIDPNMHRFTYSKGGFTGNSVDLYFAGAPQNVPLSDAEFHGQLVNNGAQIRGTLRIWRTDQVPAINWSVTFPITVSK